jgi:branched-chain amino acid transport system substrate-binding protein
MVGAIKLVLAQRRYRAGKWRVGFQSCDDSNPQGQAGDLGRCTANAKAYAGNRAVVGVVGTWFSRCTGFELPLANRAPGGPLVYVSPSNTDVGLTHAGPGTAPDVPGRYYPTHKRNFVRVIAADDAQGAAGALLAKELKARTAFVLDDKDGYGLEVAATFRHAARRIGVKILGSASWDPTATEFDALVRQVARARPQAVYLGGTACPSCGKLLQGLKAALGKKLFLIAPDGWYPLSDLIAAVGPATEGMFVSALGTTTGNLGPAAGPIVRRFGGAVPGSGGPPYAAQAAAVLLDAIARSDGSRASVTSRVFKARVRNGILGSFGFDRYGDTTTPAVTFFRARHGRQTIDRVIAPRPSLIH